MKSLIPAAAAALVLVATVPSGAAELAVWRGGITGAGVVDGAVAHGVTVIRGSTAPAAAPRHPVAAGPIVPRIAAGGERLWLYDPANHRATVCRDMRTSRVGGRHVECRSEALGL